MNEEQTETAPIEPEVVKDEIELRRPSIPVTIDELASLPEARGPKIVELRSEIVRSLRKASIALTSPQDWLLFKAEDRITAYLQDQGCSRVKALWGISITPIEDFVTTTLPDQEDGDYAISCKANGYCAITDETILEVEGVRYSTEDFCKDLAPLQKKVRVQQAAVANRNGNIVRTLTGLKNVAIEEIKAVYENLTPKKDVALCPHGRGFGDKYERAGGKAGDQTPKDIPAPLCEVCGKKMKFVPGGTSRASGKEYAAFWTCPDYKKVDGKSNGHSAINDTEYRKELASRQPGGEG